MFVPAYPHPPMPYHAMGSPGYVGFLYVPSTYPVRTRCIESSFKIEQPTPEVSPDKKA